jgi:hypothetical protein
LLISRADRAKASWSSKNSNFIRWTGAKPMRVRAVASSRRLFAQHPILSSFSSNRRAAPVVAVQTKFEDCSPNVCYRNKTI